MNRVTKESIKLAVNRLKTRQTPVNLIVSFVMELNGLSQADISRTVGVSRAAVSRFVNNKCRSKKLNKYFKRVLFVDVHDLYRSAYAESLKKAYGGCEMTGIVERINIDYPYLGVLVSKWTINTKESMVIVEKGSVIALEHKFVAGEACPCCGARISDIEQGVCGLCDWHAYPTSKKLSN